jgi:tail protein
MSNSTEEYWEVNGTSLNQFCWSIKTLGGSRLAVPKLRGDNTLFPYRDGRAFRSKFVDSRVITLAMWVAGIDPATDQPRTSRQDVQFNDNWKTLQRLFWSPDNQLTVTRRWWENATSPTLREATALCELAGTMDPTMTGRTRADFAVDLLLADPYFYGPEISTELTVGDDVVVHNPGDISVWTTINMTMNGELVSPTITNKTTGVWMRVNTAVLANPINVDVGAFTVVNSFDDSNLLSAVTHAGAKPWIKLDPGDNTLELTSLGNSTGDVDLRFKPAYL